MVMRSVALIALLTFAGTAEVLTANDMNDSQHSLDKLVDGLVDELFADKSAEEGEDGAEDEETEDAETEEGDENEDEAMESEDEEGDETEEDEGMDSGDEEETEDAEVEEGDETENAEEDEEEEAGDLVDVLADNLVARMLTVSFLPNADLVLGLRGGAKKKKAPKKTKTTKAKKAPKKKKATAKGKGTKKKKVKKVSKIAKGKFAKALVFRGSKVKTASGLTKGDLLKNKAGKIVTKKQVAKGKALYAKYAKNWISALMKARKALGVKGFAAVKKGTPLYTKAKSFYSSPSTR